jgi:hypothetical protein
MTSDTRAIWRDNPMTLTWSLHLVRGGRGAGLYEVALPNLAGGITWAERTTGVAYDDPPLLTLPDWILRDLVLPAAPGAPKPAQLAGRVDQLTADLEVERARVDRVLAAALQGVSRA